MGAIKPRKLARLVFYYPFLTYCSTLKTEPHGVAAPWGFLFAPAPDSADALTGWPPGPLSPRVTYGLLSIRHIIGDPTTDSLRTRPRSTEPESNRPFGPAGGTRALNPLPARGLKPRAYTNSATAGFSQVRIPCNHASRLGWPVVFAVSVSAHLVLQHVYLANNMLLDTGAGGHLLSAPAGSPAGYRSRTPFGTRA